MKYYFTYFLFLTISFFSFSQVITFECNDEIIVISFDEIANDINAYTDWNEDGVVDETDYVIYLEQLYDCQDVNNWGDDEVDDWNGEGDDEENDWNGEGDGEENDWGDDFDGNDIFTFECNGEEIVIELTDITDFIDYESYIDAILSDYDCEEWGNEDNDWDGEGDDKDNDWDGEGDDWNGEGDDEENDWNGEGDD